jgi:hypothetical protein
MMRIVFSPVPAKVTYYNKPTIMSFRTMAANRALARLEPKVPNAKGSFSFSDLAAKMPPTMPWNETTTMTTTTKTPVPLDKVFCGKAPSTTQTRTSQIGFWQRRVMVDASTFPAPIKAFVNKREGVKIAGLKNPRSKRLENNGLWVAGQPTSLEKAAAEEALKAAANRKEPVKSPPAIALEDHGLWITTECKRRPPEPMSLDMAVAEAEENAKMVQEAADQRRMARDNLRMAQQVAAEKRNKWWDELRIAQAKVARRRGAFDLAWSTKMAKKPSETEPEVVHDVAAKKGSMARDGLTKKSATKKKPATSKKFLSIHDFPVAGIDPESGDADFVFHIQESKEELDNAVVGLIQEDIQKGIERAEAQHAELVARVRENKKELEVQQELRSADEPMSNTIFFIFMGFLLMTFIATGRFCIESRRQSRQNAVNLSMPDLDNYNTTCIFQRTFPEDKSCCPSFDATGDFAEADGEQPCLSYLA